MNPGLVHFFAPLTRAVSRAFSLAGDLLAANNHHEHTRPKSSLVLACNYLMLSGFCAGCAFSYVNGDFGTSHQIVVSEMSIFILWLRPYREQNMIKYDLSTQRCPTMTTIERLTVTMPKEMATALKQDIDKGLANVAAGRTKEFDAHRIAERGRKLLAAPST